MKSATYQPYLRVAVLFAAVVAMLWAGTGARAEAPVRGDGDGGMPIVVVVSGNPEETPSPTPGGSGGGNGGNGGNGGGLPRTGLNILLIAGVGAGLVALGAAARVAARRRSVAPVAPPEG